MKKIPLTKAQKEIIEEFYNINAAKVVFDKKDRNILWGIAKKREVIPEEYNIKENCPALFYEIEQSYTSGNNIQSAVFSECVYAQTLANMFNLTVFKNCRESTDHIPKEVVELLESYFMLPRYSYATSDGKRMLIQAGGYNSIDSALISVFDLNVYTIEFKEPAAKTTEPDLPKYSEDGKLLIDEKFKRDYPHFIEMLNQHIGTSMFDVMGSNINDFTKESIIRAVSDNYNTSKKFADVCCTEDVEGYLVMMPVNQISLWAELEGEIRPAGRNHYDLWTPEALKNKIVELGGKVEGNELFVPITKITYRKARGGNNQITGYKITPLFFVRFEMAKVENETLICNLESVRQLNPTIAGKMFFKKLRYNEVKKHYIEENK